MEQEEEQMESLKTRAQYQEEEIQALQKVARELRRIDEREKDRKAGVSAFDGPQRAPEPESDNQKNPLSKYSLNNILSVLDKIENEARKQN
jgi:hypothetical protein